jgi:hypothetical protein
MSDLLKPKGNPLLSYLRHAVTFGLMKLTGDHLPMEQLPEAVSYVADAVVLGVYWFAVKYGVAICKNKIVPWLDKIASPLDPPKFP